MSSSTIRRSRRSTASEPFTNQRIQILDRLRFGTTRVIVQTLDEPKGMTIVDDSPSRPFATYNPPMPLEFVRSIVARPERELVHGASGTAEDSLLWTIDSALPSGVLRAPAEPGLAIANDPGDAATREVYADLLIERGHADAAACVRGSNRDAGTPRWRAIVARGPITACSNQRCRNDWSRLLAVRVDGAIDIRERICDVCDDHVHYCTDRESVHWASTGQFRRVIDPAAEP